MQVSLSPSLPLTLLSTPAACSLPASPINYNSEPPPPRYPVRYEESMNTVLAQEMSRFNRLTAVMKDSLRNISLAIQVGEGGEGEGASCMRAPSICRPTHVDGAIYTVTMMSSGLEAAYLLPHTSLPPHSLPPLSPPLSPSPRVYW